MKRLDWILAIAKKMVDVTFDLAVANVEQYSEGASLQAQAAQLPNVVWHGTVARAKMPEIYQRATCLCCTSSYEGFPNTFLEAWSFGRPVVTSFDPDGLIARRNLGYVGSSIDELATAIQNLMAAPWQWWEQSRNARHYYAETHTPGLVMPKIERELLSTLRC